MKSTLDLAPTPPISSLLSSLPIFLPSLGRLKSTFVDFKTFVIYSPCLDQTLDTVDIERLEDHFEVKDLILGHPMSFDFYISFDCLCLGPFPSPPRNVGLHFRLSDHCRWPMHSYNHIIVRSLTCASNFAYTQLCFD